MWDGRMMNDLFENKSVARLNSKITLISWHDVRKLGWKLQLLVPEERYQSANAQAE
jgi:hypothetical protein